MFGWNHAGASGRLMFFNIGRNVRPLRFDEQRAIWRTRQVRDVQQMVELANGVRAALEKDNWIPSENILDRGCS